MKNLIAIRLTSGGFVAGAAGDQEGQSIAIQRAGILVGVLANVSARTTAAADGSARAEVTLGATPSFEDLQFDSLTLVQVRFSLLELATENGAGQRAQANFFMPLRRKVGLQSVLTIWSNSVAAIDISHDYIFWLDPDD